MNPGAMAPFGAALKAYCGGDTSVNVMVRRDDGVEGLLPISHFFREFSAFTRIEREALDRCRGQILDAGAGTGVHALELQRRGLAVKALDVCGQAVEIMAQRGVRDTICCDIFSYHNHGFDTILLLGHGLGMMEAISGLDQFLLHAHMLVADGGQILVDSMDPARTKDPQNLAYHAANRSSGKYAGEVRMRFEFQQEIGPYCGWLHVDPETFYRHAASAGWTSSIVIQEPSGDYLAQLTMEDH
jgi:SAM-dependent methyltransferase